MANSTDHGPINEMTTNLPTPPICRRTFLIFLAVWPHRADSGIPLLDYPGTAGGRCPAAEPLQDAGACVAAPGFEGTARALQSADGRHDHKGTCGRESGIGKRLLCRMPLMNVGSILGTGKRGL